MGDSGSYPVSVSSLYFPSAVQSLSQTLSLLRQSALSITNRLKSIEVDAVFVQTVADHYGLPLVANERCGSWYIRPEKKAGSAYFKSTDGHAGHWDFSFRRLNLQILSIAREHGGCVIVDSTRRGKLMPDALSKTIPIWCAVMNRALFPSETVFHPVQFPPNYLGALEESEIEKKIHNFVMLLTELKLDLKDLSTQLGKPIRIAWANQSYFYPTDLRKGSDFNFFVLCSASKRVHGAEMSEAGYIQGAGDDSEGWSYGLNPLVFWTNKTTLLATAESDLPELIKSLMEQNCKQKAGIQTIQVQPTHNLYISQICDNLNHNAYDLVIDCNGRSQASSESPKKLNLGCRPSKLGSRDLRKSLNQVITFVDSHLGGNPSCSLLVTCETGKDLSAGTLLAVLCLFYDDCGQFIGLQSGKHIDKQFIRQRLAWIISSKHDVNPSRTTLQAVNAFLMRRLD